MVKIKEYLVENLSLFFVDFSKDLKIISKKEFNSQFDKDIFIDFNIASLLLSSQLKNDKDEISFSIYNLDYIKEMIIYLRKDKEKILYASNINYSSDKLKSPYLVQNTKFESKTYSSSIKVNSKNIEATMNNFISTSIQSKSFIRLLNNKGILVSVIGGKKSKLYNEIKLFDKNQLLCNCINDIINCQLFNSYDKRLISDVSVEYKCICSLNKCIDIVKSLLQQSNNLFDSEKEISLSCPICGSKYVVSEKDLLRRKNENPLD